MMARDEMLNDVAARLARLVSANTIRVGIDGIDAAGKTTLGDELAQRLRALRPVIRSGIDHFHNPREIRYAKGAESPHGYYEDSFNLDCLIEKLLRPLGPGGTGRYQTAHFDHRRNLPVDCPEMKAAPATVLLFDGIFLLRPRLRPYWDYSIFVKVGFDVALARSLRRDLPAGGDPARLEQRYRSRYLPGQQRYLAECEPESHADLIIENNDPSNAFVRYRLTPR
jgi:uridine kinase